eukprot:TRINITY_DN13563_c0_g1_i1.p1 TRINITY_DN13563_c0_g1~~TRINITY_DN13563_c0_g1_i1.p1  ORF type:complete len:112 (+),score=4.91 TRINITY_DN13563_c0_g1_i1:56-391(+)
MGILFQTYLSGQVYTCRKCNVHLAHCGDNIISKQFQGRQGKAYLFNSCVNTYSGPEEDRFLITGLHTVADIHCISCQEYLGWKYEQAYEESQKYKVGKFIIEKAKMKKEAV